MHDAQARHSGSPRLVGAGLLLAALASLAAPRCVIADDHGAAYAGCVLDITGTWNLVGKPGRVVALGQALFAGDALLATGSKATIEIGYLDKPVLKRDCRTKGACTNPIRITVDRPHETSLVEMMVHASEMLEREPSRYVTAMGRGAVTTMTAHDHVAALAEGGILLAPAFDASPGRYRVAAYRVRAGRVDSASVEQPRTVTWPPAGDDARLVVEPGLYKLVLETQTVPSTAADAWVLAESGDRHAAVRARVAELTRATEGWEKQDGGGGRTARGLRRALLVLVADGS